MADAEVPQRDRLGRTNANWTRKQNERLALGKNAMTVADAVDHLAGSGRVLMIGWCLFFLPASLRSCGCIALR